MTTPSYNNYPGFDEFNAAYRTNNVAAVRDVLVRYPKLIKHDGFAEHWMEDADGKGNQEMVMMLFEVWREPPAPAVDKVVLRRFGDACENNDLASVRDLLMNHPELTKEENVMNYRFREAARKDNVELVSLLVEFGADIHKPDGQGSPPGKEGVIYYAASGGAINVVRWLLDRGAQMNFEYEEFPGESRCMPLTAAIQTGKLELVKLLVERGANINALWGPYTPLCYAIMYGKKEIEACLRSQGALEPWQIKGEKPPYESSTILPHIEKHFGRPQLLSLQGIVPGDPPISIHVVLPTAERNNIALVTEGMSSRPMTVPSGGENFQFAELVMYLPPAWPLTAEALQDPENFWPIEWLRRIAHYPHDQHTWLGGPTTVIANGEPPQPLGPGTTLTSFFVFVGQDEARHLRLPDGRLVVFYTTVALYTEERDLEKAGGTQRLIQLLDKYHVDLVTDPQRINAVWANEVRKKR